MFEQIIRKGSAPLTWTNHHIGPRHTFTADSPYTVKVDLRTYTQLAVVKNGPDKGTYILHP